MSATPFLKASCLKTSSTNLMHQPHQSDPVKSTSRSLFSAAAFCLAASKSVIHSSPAAVEIDTVSASNRLASIVFFMIMECRYSSSIFFSEMNVKYGEFVRWCPMITTLVEEFVFSCKQVAFQVAEFVRIGRMSWHGLYSRKSV